jgi:hypothetical protein
MIDEARRDAIFALRSLRRAKGFTAAVVLTLALGIGANATMYAIINAVVLHPVSGVRDPPRSSSSANRWRIPPIVISPNDAIAPARRDQRAAHRLGARSGGRSHNGALVSGNLFASSAFRPRSVAH